METSCGDMRAPQSAFLGAGCNRQREKQNTFGNKVIQKENLDDNVMEAYKASKNHPAVVLRGYIIASFKKQTRSLIYVSGY